jgi:hypothetical protein
MEFHMIQINIDPQSKNVPMTVTLDRFIHAVLTEEAVREKTSIARIINRILARQFEERITLKELQEKNKPS